MFGIFFHFQRYYCAKRKVDHKLYIGNKNIITEHNLKIKIHQKRKEVYIIAKKRQKGGFIQWNSASEK